MNKEKGAPSCIKETWISEAPKTLIFTLNRVQYDPKAFCSVKNNKHFQFEKIIYADKYMMINMGIDKNIEEIIKPLKD
jgi:ubiquitin carboxyl-terminal hydrolase 25/28